MTDLEIFAKMTIDKGGEWFTLERGDDYSIYESKGKYMVNHNYFYESPVYQIFDKNGNRVLATTDMRIAFAKFNQLRSDKKW